MTTDLTHAERAELLLDEPERYEEIVEAYEDGTEFYKKTRSKVPKVTDDFQDYLSFHRTFIERGPTGYIFHRLNRNTNRSIKNMIVGGSEAGENFRIYTLRQAAQRVNSYQELGVQHTSLHGVVTTLLEELYEERANHKFIYHILSTLLNRVPHSERDAVDLVARARLVAGLDPVHNEQRALEELRKYLDVTNDPRPDDNQTADEILDEVNHRSFGDPELVDLYGAALHRDPSLESLSDYLYFTGRDVVERYRHRNREEPTVGELHLSQRQMAVIQEFSVDREPENAAYIRSYHHLTLGLYYSGREWRSEQDPGKTEDSEFMKAAQEYLRAAAAIKTWNSERYIKYLNKAFRHAANAADTWQGKVEIHDRAIVALIEAGQQIDDDAANKAIADSKQLQDFWSLVAKSYTHLRQDDPDQAHESAIAAEEQLQKIDMKISSFILQRSLTLSEGLLLEKEEAYDRATSRYDKLNADDEIVEARKNIAQIKSFIQNEESDEALEYSLSKFGKSSLITTAVRAINDNEITTQRSHGTLPDDLLVCDGESVEWRLQSLLSLYVGTNEFRTMFRNHIQLALMEL